MKGGGRGRGFESTQLTFPTKINKLTLVDKKKESLQNWTYAADLINPTKVLKNSPWPWFRPQHQDFNCQWPQLGRQLSAISTKRNETATWPWPKFKTLNPTLTIRRLRYHLRILNFGLIQSQKLARGVRVATLLYTILTRSMRNLQQ